MNAKIMQLSKVESCPWTQPVCLREHLVIAFLLPDPFPFILKFHGHFSHALLKQYVKLNDAINWFNTVVSTKDFVAQPPSTTQAKI